MMNLLQETLAVLEDNHKNPSDILWVGKDDGDYAMSWEDFTKIADIEYDDGYGGAEIEERLVIVGDNWWLERHEYDGSEEWRFKSLPIKSPNPKSFSSVKVGEYLTAPTSCD